MIDQTLTDWELVVVDDCSTEDARSIVSDFADSRIHYVRNGVNCQLPRSLNRGFALASGEYLTWTSDDNWYAPEALEVMASVLDNHPSIGLVCAAYQEIPEGNVKTRGVVLPEPPVLLPYRNTVGACFMYRRSVAESVGEYDPDAALAEDYQYWIRVHNRHRIVGLNQVLYYYRLHAGSLTETYGENHITKLARQVSANVLSRRRRFEARVYLFARSVLKQLGHGRRWLPLFWLRWLCAVVRRRYESTIWNTVNAPGSQRPAH